MGVSNNNDNNIHSNLSATSAIRAIRVHALLVPQFYWRLHHCEAAAHLSLNQPNSRQSSLPCTT